MEGVKPCVTLTISAYYRTELLVVTDGYLVWICTIGSATTYELKVSQRNPNPQFPIAAVQTSKQW